MNYHSWKTKYLQKAENYWLFGFVLTILLPILSLIVAKIEKSPTTDKSNWFYIAIASLLCLLFPLAIQCLKAWSQSSFEIGDKFNRYLFYDHSLNIKPSNHQILSLLPLTVRVIAEDNVKDSDYFDSKTPHGHRKMIENLMETAFFTSKLAAFTAFILWFVLFGSILVVFIAIYLTFNLQVITHTNLLQIALAATALFATSEVFFVACQYREFATASDRVVSGCSFLLDKEAIDQQQALLLVEEYHLLRIKNPPIISYIYRWKRDELNAIYKKVIAKNG